MFNLVTTKLSTKTFDAQIQELTDKLKQTEDALDEAKTQIEETRSKVVEEESSSEDEEDDKTKKYQRLLELEEDADLLSKKLEQKEVAMKSW